MALSLTTHELDVTVSCFLCQPKVVFPSNSSTQPESLWAGVKVLSPCDWMFKTVPGSRKKKAAPTLEANRLNALVAMHTSLTFHPHKNSTESTSKTVGVHYSEI